MFPTSFQIIFGQSPMSLALTANTDSHPRNILLTLLRTRPLTCSSHSHKQQMTMPWVQTIYTCSRFPVYLMHFVPQGFIALKVSKKQLTKKWVNFILSQLSHAKQVIDLKRKDVNELWFEKLLFAKHLPGIFFFFFNCQTTLRSVECSSH